MDAVNTINLTLHLGIGILLVLDYFLGGKTAGITSFVCGINPP